MPDSPQGDISAQSEVNSGQKRNRPERSNAKVRASIACVPCRSKHARCDGFLPSCTRCKEEGERCHYVSSRRGIRDPKKRNMIKDDASITDQDNTTEITPSPSPSNFNNPFLSQKHILDLYYANFHVAHSWTLPRPILEQHLKANPNGMRFLEATIAYIASRYSTIDSGPFWERAFEMSHEPPPPPNLWTVQALLSLSIASFGERDDLYRYLFIKACNLALHLGLQRKECADEQGGFYVAESRRRTYWGLYVHEMLLGIRDIATHSPLYPIESTESTELPCKEWEYAAGTTSTTVSFAEYGHLGASCDQSSWASLIYLVRIHDCCVVQFLHEHEASSDALEYANELVGLWRNTLKGPKMERVDENGTVDMILYSALIISYGLQIRMQLHFYGLQEAINGGHLNLYTARLRDSVAVEFDPSLPPILQAPLRLISLFNHFLPEKFSPSCIPYLHLAAGLLITQSNHESKVRFFSSNLGRSGECWSKSKMISKKISDYLDHTPVGAGYGTSHIAHSQAMATNTDAIANTVLQAGDPHWIIADGVGHISSWPGLAQQSVMAWSEISSQSINGSPMTYVVPANSAESFQNVGVEADSSSKASPYVKAEGWLE